MIVELDPAFGKLSSKELTTYGVFVEYLLIKHTERRILFFVPPNISAQLRDSIEFGPYCKAALSLIDRHVQDYNSIKSHVGLSLRVVPREVQIGLVCDGKRMIVEDVDCRQLIECGPRLFLENSANDAAVYRLLVDCYLDSINFPRVLVDFETFHRGWACFGRSDGGSWS